VDGFAHRTALFIGRRRRRLVVLWIVLVAVAGIGAAGLAGVLSGGGWYVKGSDSYAAAVQLRHGFTGRGPTTATLVVRDTRHTARDAAFPARVGAVADDVRATKKLHVTSVVGYTSLPASARGSYLGKDARTITDSVAIDVDDGTARRELPAIEKTLEDRYQAQGLDVSLVAPASFWGEVNTLSQTDLGQAEMITAPLIVVILLLLFRSVASVAAALASGITGILLTLGALSLIAHQMQLSLFVENAATMIGLGVGVDYALFLISRFKRQLAEGDDTTTALATTLRTAGHTIVASGSTIVVAMCTLFVVDLNVIFSLALGAILVVAFSVLSASLFLPVLLHLLGPRINAGRIRLRRRSAGPGREEDSRWYRIAQSVMRRPVVVLVAVTVPLVLLALPALGMKTYTPDARILPAASSVRTGYQDIEAAFGTGAPSPMQTVVTSTSPVGTARTDTALLALQRRLAALPGVASVQSATGALKAVSATDPYSALQPSVWRTLPDSVRRIAGHYVDTARNRTVIEVVPSQASSTPATRKLLTRVRAAVADPGPGLHAVVGGQTAEDTDANRPIADGLPFVVALMLVAVYLLLLATFRSVLLPLKAIVMNVLSIAATYGILVGVFQHGFATGLLHFDHTGYLQNFVPVLLLALLFSLSTDYEVFLLDRIREEYVGTGDNTRAVALGLTRTAPLISGAAILMVAVFGAFGFTGLVPIQQLGFGLALAVLIDATVVRLLIVPAAMRLMGRWNWWMPGRPDPAGAARTAGTRTAPETAAAGQR
jgi:RND superfamily putative drug exporter